MAEKLLVGIAELDSLSMPPWAGSVAEARSALVAHQQTWIALLEDERRLASRISNETSLDRRQELVRDLVDVDELASPSIGATAQRRQLRQ